jgi:hypothetical protein
VSHKFYIEVPNNYKYDWSIAKIAHEVLSTEYNAAIEFICNTGARISEGDVFSVTTENVGDELFFLLKTGFKKMNTHDVETYLQAKIIARQRYPGKARAG